jgi:hypothetical protein
MIDPVTTAILAAIAAGATAGITDTTKKAIGDAYRSLKGTLIKKLGGQSTAVEAISKLEQRPDSAGWKETVTEELAKVGINHDQELIVAAEEIMSKLQQLPEGERQHIMQATGSYIAQADRGGTAKVTVTPKT